MIQSYVGHVQLNIDLQNIGFYKDLFNLLGWSVLYDDPSMLGVADTHGASFWFGGVTKDVKNDYDGAGMNHMAISVSAQTDVDQVVAFLQNARVPALFETPRHRPDFSSAGQTYYQVMFESPDRILFEVVYTGPISN